MKHIERILQYLADRKGPIVKLETILDGTGLTRKEAIRILLKLEEENLLKRVKANRRAPNNKEKGRFRDFPTWSLVSRKRYRARIRGKAKPGAIRDKMWKLIRMKNVFTSDDLVTTASVDYQSAQSYIKVLVHNSYIKRISSTGTTKRTAVYQLLKNPGPKRPVLSEPKKKKKGTNK